MEHQKLTRLDRLFGLLHSGTSNGTRKAAAQQIGQIQKNHPHELYSLLFRVQQYLQSPSWDTRTAAGYALEAICKEVPQWNPSDFESSTTDNQKEESDAIHGTVLSFFSFQNFNIEQVLEEGSPLLASGGSEYDIPLYDLKMEPSERLAKQRQLMEKKMGLKKHIDADLVQLIEEEDVMIHTPEPIVQKTPVESKHLAGVIQAKELSAREKAKLKRETRMQNQKATQERMKEKRRRAGDAGVDELNKSKKAKKTKSVAVDQCQEPDKLLIDSAVDVDAILNDTTIWYFDQICTELMNQLFDPAWEIRHGAGIGLRSILSVHATGAGKVKNQSDNEMKNRQWLEDCAVRLLCVLALDRFGDYSSERTVAPVRETCAQTLSVVLQHLPKDTVIKCIHELIKLKNKLDWEVRQGSMLGIKYSLAVRTDLIEETLPYTFPVFCGCLSDTDDDVRAIAADALLSIANDLATLLIKIKPENITCQQGAGGNKGGNIDSLSHLLRLLWDALESLDDLSASTQPIVNLLAKLHSINAAGPSIEAMLHSLLLTPKKVQNANPLSVLLPRLYPFFRHNIASVRLATLTTISQLLLSGGNDTRRIDHPCNWIDSTVPQLPHLIFQNLLMEENPNAVELLLPSRSPQSPNINSQIVHETLEIWKQSLNLYSQVSLQTIATTLSPKFLSLIMTPNGGSFCKDDLFVVTTIFRGQELRHDAWLSLRPAASTSLKLNGVEGMSILFHRVAALDVQWVNSTIVKYLQSVKGYEKEGILWVLDDWAKHWFGNHQNPETPVPVKAILDEIKILIDAAAGSYEELDSYWNSLQLNYTGFWQLLESYGYKSDYPTNPSRDQLIQLAAKLGKDDFPNIVAKISSSRDLGEDDKSQLQSKASKLLVGVGGVKVTQARIHGRIVLAGVECLISWNFLPDKLSTIINTMMKTIKTQTDIDLQSRASKAFPFMFKLISTRNPSPINKILINLLAIAASDKSKIPQPKSAETKEGTDTESIFAGRGGAMALIEIVKYFDASLLVVLPKLWDIFEQSFKTLITTKAKNQPKDDSQHIENLFCLSIVLPYLSKNLKSNVVSLFPYIGSLVSHENDAVRHINAMVFASICRSYMHDGMSYVISKVVPALNDSTDEKGRLGSALVIHEAVAELDVDLVPYIPFLIVPLLGRMSDQEDAVRRSVTKSFAHMVKLMPLELGTPDPPEFDAQWGERRKHERKFVEQLMDGSKIEKFKIPIKIAADLRSYQQDGVNWLNFLRKYRLHGILCDDMGLGKTLQTLTIVVSDIHERREKYSLSKDVDSKPIPSLVICPSTVIGHWNEEIIKFFGNFVNPLMYVGSTNERSAIRKRFGEAKGAMSWNTVDIVITSYEILRNDLQYFMVPKESAKKGANQPVFNYCVLDEGHIIKNPKAKITQAVKSIKSNHRLILSGTPIQNNVLELWSLFDFLMPGFLGTEQSFNHQYSKPILQSKSPSCTDKQKEEGELALESLHRQVLPFLLRRLKEDVLADLPPKIIQDYRIELTPFQAKLYEDFSQSTAKKSIVQEIEKGEVPSSPSYPGSEATSSSNNIFQALQYLRKLCAHPLLVFNEKHPKYKEMIGEVGSLQQMHAIEHCPKLVALKQILLDCGIGVSEENNSDNSTGDASSSVLESASTNHRVLIFAQFKDMLDLIETDLLKAHMKNVSYLRLDGKTPHHLRHNIVTTFNNNPTIDVLLLTTQVGGLGLNLTGADIVIFVEHDWNPMKDLQAMDRAHRIGQKKVVQVYRLITKHTLEEKIMSLQKFKINIANTVVNADNSSLLTMDTDQLLDLFQLSEDAADKRKKETDSMQFDIEGTVEKPKKATTGLKALLQEIGELWDEKGYEEEYNMQGFLESLK